ncbi:MAG: hypothetical protein FD180_227 [Planctomycetota bacterium]|nr:MAG: hypothetical protein FD180_227 [Planctomycetota bacterium]
MARHVVVVGAGIIGMAVAMRIRQRNWEVTILEAARPGAGASSAALGSLTPYSDHGCSLATRRIAELSVATYPKWITELKSLSGSDIDFDDSGLLELAIGKEEEAALRSSFSVLQGSNAPVEWLDADSVHQMEPNATPETVGAIYYKSEAMVDVTQLLVACERAILRLGCRIASATRVTRILESAGRIQGVETQSGTLRSDAVVIATGANLATIQGVPRIPIERVRGEVVEVKAVPGLVGRHLYSGDGFMTPRRNGRILLGSNYDVHVHGDDECPSTASARSVLRTLAATIRMVPAISSLQLQRTWKEWRPRTPDGQPVVGCIGPEGLVVATGFFGLGITLSPAIGEIVAEILDGKVSALADSLNPGRFFDGSQ